MALTFKLTKSQKETLSAYFDESQKPQWRVKIWPVSIIIGKKKQSKWRLQFVENAICIDTANLKELFQKGYAHILVKKDGNHFHCVSFEIIVLLKLLLQEDALNITGFIDSDSKIEKEKMNSIVSEYVRAGHNISRKIRAQCIDMERVRDTTYTCFECQTEISEGQHGDVGDLHTHTYHPPITEHEAPSPYDFEELMLEGGAVYFSAVLTLNVHKFMGKLKEREAEAKVRGNTIFDENGFLRSVDLIKIAQELAAESTEEKSLKALYNLVGMPLVGVRRIDYLLEVFTKLKITK